MTDDGDAPGRVETSDASAGTAAEPTGLGSPPIPVDLPDLVGVLPDGVSVIDTTATIIWINAAMASMLGYRPDELVGRSGLELMHPDDVDVALNGIAFATRFPSRTVAVPYRLVRADGTAFEAELRNATVTGPDGTEVIILIARDGSARSTVGSALAAIAGHRPLDECAHLILEACRHRWKSAAIAVGYHLTGSDAAPDPGTPPDPDHAPGGQARPVVAAHRMPAAHLAMLDRQFARAVAFASEAEVVALEDLDQPWAHALRADGHEALALVGAVTRSGDRCLVQAAFEHPDLARLDFPRAAAELMGLLLLAVETARHDTDLTYAARHDALTGLANRAAFFDDAEALVAAAPAGACSLLFVDLDGFKQVNDALGHAAGDSVLRTAGRRLADAARPNELAARIGGDEFALVIHADHGPIEHRCAQILSALTAPVALTPEDLAPLATAPDQAAVTVTATIGTAPVQPGQPISEALRAADAAMYAAKSSRP